MNPLNTTSSFAITVDIMLLAMVPAGKFLV
jgi:hypothetical protein